VQLSLNPSFAQKGQHLDPLCQQLPSPASTFLGVELISESGPRGKRVSCFNASQIADCGVVPVQCILRVKF